MTITTQVFERASIDLGAHTRPVAGYKITCSKCGAVEKVPSNTHSGAMAQEVLRRKFINKGWSVATRPGKHVCPMCLDAKKKVFTDKLEQELDLLVTEIDNRPAPATLHPVAKPLPTVTPPTVIVQEEVKMTEPKSKYHASFLEQQAIYNRLTENLRKVDGTKEWEYLNDYTDERIAKAVNEKLSAHHVHHIRMQAFGPLKRKAGDISHFKDRHPAGVFARVKRLEEAFAAIARDLGVDPGKYLKLDE